ncbi:high-affinity Zn(2+) transporter zrt1 [Gamsiella multidivaricata]|nr:high-affinity Zn(2+) transporter zrt1 [Gamsiella multidivaricata]
MNTNPSFSCMLREDLQDRTHYRLALHIVGIFIILAASAAGVFMPLIASRFQRLCFSSRLLILGKQFGIGIILATAFIHMMPTAITNLSSPCLGPIFSENYTAFGGLLILSSSLFMHWIEFMAIDHHQQCHETAADWGTSLPEDERVSLDLDGLEPTGAASALYPGHTLTVLDEPMRRRSSCSSASPCVLDHDNLATQSGCSTFEPEMAQSTTCVLPSAVLIQRTPVRTSVKSYGSIQADNRAGDTTSAPLAEDYTEISDRHHHHFQETRHSHAHGLELLNDSQRRISTYILEAGIAAHSVIIGVSLGVSSEAEFMGLLTALVFHQFFEGFALGARITDLEFERTKTHYWLAIVFSLTTPIGAALGVAIWSSYDPSSALAILVEGVFDAISTGILLYMGYVNLLAVEFNLNDDIRKESTRVKSMCFMALWTSAAVMAVLGRFA